jgi:hypothetical protein
MLNFNLSNQPTKLKPQSGVTIVELLVYMGIFMGFLVLLSGMFVSTLDVQQTATDTARIEQDSQYLYSRLQYDINRATAVTTPANDGDTSQTLALTTATGNISYILDNNQLKLVSAAGTNVLTSPEIMATSVSFQKLGDGGDAKSIRIQLNLQSTKPGVSNPESRQLIYTFGNR